MLYHNTWWTIFFISTFFIIIMLYFYSIFISLYAENFRRVVTEIGYPEDQDLNKWNIKDYIEWFTTVFGEKKKEESDEKN